jgi:hypothetical protein
MYKNGAARQSATENVTFNGVYAKPKNEWEKSVAVHLAPRELSMFVIVSHVWRWFYGFRCSMRHMPAGARLQCEWSSGSNI